MTAVSVKYAGPERRCQQRRENRDRRIVKRIERSLKNRRTITERRR